MIGTNHIGVVFLLIGLMLLVAVPAAAEEPKSSESPPPANRPVEKVPTKIAGTYQGGELVELRVRDRIA